MVAIGTLGVILAAVDLLREVLEKAGIDRSKAAQIVGEFVSRLKVRVGRTEGAEGETDARSAVVRDSWEYSVLTLSRASSWRGAKPLVLKFRDGEEMSGTEATEPAAYLNRASEDGWEIMSVLGEERSATLILRRLRSLGG